MLLFGIILGLIIGGYFVCDRYRKKIKLNMQMSDKHLEMFLLMNKWFMNKREGKNISDYLIEKGYQNVTIYGMGYIGKCLYEELKNENYEIKDLIDQNQIIKVKEKKVKSLNEQIEVADAIIVTAIYNFEEIEERLKDKFNIPILSLEDIIYKMV